VEPLEEPDEEVESSDDDPEEVESSDDDPDEADGVGEADGVAPPVEVVVLVPVPIGDAVGWSSDVR
jgi:hypothetical protein